MPGDTVDFFVGAFSKVAHGNGIARDSNPIPF